MTCTSLNQHPVLQEVAPTQAAIQATSNLGCVVHPIAEAVNAGRAAWGRIRSHHVWEDWKLVIYALAEGRLLAMRQAHTNEPKGRRYNEEFGAWLKDTGFADIEPTTRKRALLCADNMGAIETFLASLDPDKRLTLNHPASVLAAWKRSTTKLAGTHEKPKPQPASLDRWRALSDDEIREGLASDGIPRFLEKYLPANWHNELANRVARPEGKHKTVHDRELTARFRDLIRKLIEDNPENPHAQFVIDQAIDIKKIVVRVGAEDDPAKRRPPLVTITPKVVPLPGG